MNTCKITLKLDGLNDWEITMNTPSHFQRRAKVDEHAGWSLETYPNDHSPPHVHCKKDGSEVVFNLNDGTHSVRGSNPKQNDMRRLLSYIKDELPRIKDEVVNRF